MMKILGRVISMVLVGILLLWVFGPRPEEFTFPEELPQVSRDLRELQYGLQERERSLPIREDNESRILWADTPYQKTRYSLVYIHGFGASPYECRQLRDSIRHKYDMNTVVARLPGHGLEVSEPFLDVDPGDWVKSTLEAVAIGQAIGDNVLVMSTSTGSTLAIYSQSRYDLDVAGHIMFSPNIEIFDPMSKLLTKPWGLQLARAVKKSKYNCWDPPETMRGYWYSCYRLEGAVALRSLIDKTMTQEVFEHFDRPMFLGCYYRDGEHQDSTVSVAAMRIFFERSATPSSLKSMVEFADGANHLIVQPEMNPNWKNVLSATEGWISDVLQYEPKISRE